jgi:ornithine carbamoyltransferase
MHVRVAAPAGYQPDAVIVNQAAALAARTGGSVLSLSEPVAAGRGAHVVAADTWVSMGQDGKQERVATLMPYQVNSELLEHAAEEAIVLHCLPAYRGNEITEEVLDGPRSVVWDQAENRLHAQKALLHWLVSRT